MRTSGRDTDNVTCNSVVSWLTNEVFVDLTCVPTSGRIDNLIHQSIYFAG
jgi:hypothetical protein